MALDVLAPDVIVYAVLLAAAGFVVSRRSRSCNCVDQKGADTTSEGGGGTDPCTWRVRVLGVADRTCVIHVSHTPIRVKRGDLLLALRPHPREAGGDDALAQRVALAGGLDDAIAATSPVHHGNTESTKAARKGGGGPSPPLRGPSVYSVLPW